jgi:hypothetical protein
VKPVVLFQGECHLLWGDMCGYVWGKKNERVEVPIVNEKERQTYLGERKYCDGSMSAPGIPKGKWRTYYSIFKVSDELIQRIPGL